MQVAMIEGVTRVIGKSQGYLGLLLRDERVDCKINGPNTAHMTSAWTPTPDELAKLNAGASVHVCIYGTSHPPIRVDVGDVP